MLNPPSAGKGPVKRPSSGSLKTPSSEEGQKKALTYACLDDDTRLYCSANSIAMQVISLLDSARSQSLDKKYIAAANYILKVRQSLTNNELKDEEINQNERLFTGAFSDGLNAVLTGGISVLHQGCIGKGSTHSDVSARYVLDGFRSPTLMVGEGKADASDRIRANTRGQLFNELIRHRQLDSKLRGLQDHDDYRPILLLALNFNYISLDLAFPSTKGGHMETSEWVTFSEAIGNGTETFWTIQVAMVNIARDNGREKLKYVLRFIADTLQFIQKLDPMPREQFKTPWWKTKPEGKVTGAEKFGDNVTIVTCLSESETGSEKKRKHVYKEFCYYLRQKDDFNEVETCIEKKDQRWPPNQELLGQLGDLYSSWKVQDGPFGIKILEYDYIEGGSWPTSKAAWLQVLKQVEIMHSNGYVHGDLLPRNLIFSGDMGRVIDFDLTRNEGNPYVSGYNINFPYRHEKARPGEKMAKEHDVWALKQMSKDFFDMPDDISAVSSPTDLAACFNQDVKLKAEVVKTGEATCSPNREEYWLDMNRLKL